MPTNTSLTFPAVIPAIDSAATPTTLNGTAEVVTDASASSEVTYAFAAGPTSGTVVDVFRLKPILDITGTPGSGTGFIQFYLGPIGTEVPNAQFPSTAIPRYDLQLLPEISAAAADVYLSHSVGCEFSGSRHIEHHDHFN